MKKVGTFTAAEWQEYQAADLFRKADMLAAAARRGPLKHETLAMTFPELAEELEKRQQQQFMSGQQWTDAERVRFTAPAEKPAEPERVEKRIHEMTLSDYQRGVARCWPKMGWM